MYGLPVHLPRVTQSRKGNCFFNASTNGLRWTVKTRKISFFINFNTQKMTYQLLANEHRIERGTFERKLKRRVDQLMKRSFNKLKCDFLSNPNWGNRHWGSFSRLDCVFTKKNFLDFHCGTFLVKTPYITIN